MQEKGREEKESGNMFKVDMHEFMSKFYEIEKTYEEKIIKRTSAMLKISHELGKSLFDAHEKMFEIKEDMNKAEEFLEALTENEENMAEMAAFSVTCEQFGITEEEAYDMLAEFNHTSNN